MHKQRRRRKLISLLLSASLIIGADAVVAGTDTARHMSVAEAGGGSCVPRMQGWEVCISLKYQELWVYRDGLLQARGVVATGDVKHDEATPAGVFHIMQKMKHPYQFISMAKPTDKVHWYPPAWVQYAVMFSWNAKWGGLYLHDAPWRTVWKNAALVSGSHGCVNMSVGLSRYIWQHVPVGTIVMITQK